MRPNKTYEKLNDVGDESITFEIEKRVREREWILIGGVKSWVRKCHHCGNIVQHTNYCRYSAAVRFNQKCEKCRQPSGKGNSFYGKKFSEKQLQKWKRERAGSGNPMYGTLGGMYGKHISEEQKLLQSKRMKSWWEKIPRDTPKYKRYRRSVDLVTAKQPIQTLEHFEKRGISGTRGAYHLDHKMSVWYGYHHNIPAEEIGNIKNLRFIPWMENQKKWRNSV